MTRPATSTLVLDGSEIKARLLAERTASKSVVHVDWVRFTCLLRNSPAPSIDDLFPLPEGPHFAPSIWDEVQLNPQQRIRLLKRELALLPDADYAASIQAKDLADAAAAALGRDYTVAPEVRKGHDFYRFRWSIERNGTECGWVGYLSSGDSPRQSAQARTIHCNLYGAACTFAEHGWNTSTWSKSGKRHNLSSAHGTQKPQIVGNKPSALVNLSSHSVALSFLIVAAHLCRRSQISGFSGVSGTSTTNGAERAILAPSL